jgi:hypothetical protein
MRAIRTTRAALGRRRTTTASLAWYMITILCAQSNAQKKSVCHVKNAQETRGVNRLTSVIDRWAKFSSRFACTLPFGAVWGGERKRPAPRPTT